MARDATASLSGCAHGRRGRARRRQPRADAVDCVRRAGARAGGRCAMRSARPFRVWSVVLAASIVCAHATPAFAYLKLGVTVDGRPVTLKWARTPVRYYVSDRGASGLSATDLQAAAARAFATWENVPTASIAYQFAGYTSASPDADDGRSTLGFLSRPDLARV